MGIPHHYQHHLDWIAQAEAILGTTGGFSILLSTGMELADASPQHYPAIPSEINSERCRGSDKPTGSGGWDTKERPRGEFREWVSQVRQSRVSINTETLRTAFETEKQPGGAELISLCPEQSTNSPQI